MSGDLLTAAAVDLAEAIRARQVSPVEVVDAHIARIEAVNPLLNALIADRFEAARREARAAEALLVNARPEELPPLHGVPCTAKEYIAVAGMPATGGGLLSRRGRVSAADATVVRRLRAAGAIVLGVSNTPEGGMWMETYNKLFGRTNNPWDLRRTPGGSSGGEGALVACGASPLGVGADIAGSIRFPAAFCGVVGHKPTATLVPTTGHWQPDGGDSGSFLCCGPIVRRARDIEPVLSIIAGPDNMDRHARVWELPRAVPRSRFEGVTVHVPELPIGSRLAAPMRRARDRACDALAARGARVVPLRSRAFRLALPMWIDAMAESMAVDGAPSFAEVLGDGVPISLVGECLRTLMGRSTVTFPALALAVLDEITSRLPRSSRAPRVDQVRVELEELLGDRGIILHPPYSRPAPRHNAPLLTPTDFVYSSVFSVLQFPVTQVPVGSSRGLPLGVQVAARRGNDPLTISVASALEEDFGGWRLAPVV